MLSNITISRMSRALAPRLLALCAIAASLAHGQTPLLDEVNTIAAPTTGVPIEHALDISIAGTYQLTLTDLGAAATPGAPLASVKLAITNGASVVGTPLIGAGTSKFTLNPGSYVVRIIGAPGLQPGSGPFGVTVDNTVGGAQVLAFSDVLALPGAAVAANESILNSSFTVAAAGSYQVNLTDFNLPQSLDALTLALVQAGGTIITTLTVSGGVPASSTVTLQPNVTYDIFAVGEASAAVNAGLYGVVVRSMSTGTVAFSRNLPVGMVALLGSTVLTAGNYTLSLADLAYPEALAQSGAALAFEGQPAVQLAATGNKAFTAQAGTYQAFALGTPAASPGTGSYALEVHANGSAAPVFSMAQAVSTTASGINAYSFSTSFAAGGAYSAQLADFAFPAALTNFAFEVVQGSTVLGTPLKGTGNIAINPSAGNLSLLVFAQAATAGGLFGVDVTPSGGENPVFETTQGVGKLFTAQKLSVTAAGSYQATVTDVGFPSSFANLAVVVTRGTSAVGSIFGGGKFPFSATSGNYFINFIAQPGGADQAGTYAIVVAATPPAPVVTLASSATSVASGAAVELTWTSENATSCTASGGWSGPQALNGSAASAALTAATTFTLTCSGAGGQAVKSVSVAINAPSSGGGGSLDGLVALFLAISVLIRAARPRRLWILEDTRAV